MEIKYKEYVIKQSNYNNHITIYKNKKLICHISMNEKKNEKELKSILKMIIKEEE